METAGALTRSSLVTLDEVVSPTALASRVAERAASIGHAGSDRPRTVVAITGPNSIEWIVSYLAVRHAGHVAMPLPELHAEAICGHHDPGVLVTPAGIRDRHRDDRHIHPDLALLLGTSGSTGAPKLVRLSHSNVAANASAIAAYLGLTSDDVAITSLPLHYCYGLSVLESHLRVGATIAVTDASVVDPCFWRLVRDRGVTNIAGVPHSFELMEHAAAASLDAPRLRLLTQAGGRMSADRVRRWAAEGRRHGWDLYVMYGQTEATARMAYLPPHLTETHPSAIGRPVPGGSIELRPHPAAESADVGEIVYRGPNVMMGYAEEPADLARGAEHDELRTGDLARFDATAGVYEIVGRASRFVKPFGMRVDLDRIEAVLAERGLTAAVAGDDALVVVAVESTDPSAAAAAHDIVVAASGLPRATVRAVACDQLPRRPNSKPDHAAVARLAAPSAAARGDDRTTGEEGGSVAAVFCDVLGHRSVPADATFVSLGGDSLSYIETALRIESTLGRLPEGWHLMPLGVLERAVEASTPPGDRRCHRVDTTTVMRALSMCAVVATHMRLHRFPGGAHLLLAVAGYNLARFLLPIQRTGARLGAAVRTAARVAVPASAWIAINMAIGGGYSLGTVLLVNNYTGSSWRRDGRWHYWFFEVFVHVVIATAVVLSVPVVRRVERRAPWGFAMGLLMPLLVLRFEWVQWGDPYNYLFRTHTVAWFFVLGWAVAQSKRRWQRVVVSLVPLATVPGFFDRPQREWFIIVALVVLVWVPSVRLPAPLARPVSLLAASSLWIYLVHWQVWPPLARLLPLPIAYAATLLVGIAAWALATAATRMVAQLVAQLVARRRAPVPSAPGRVDLDAHTGALWANNRREHRSERIPRGRPEQVAVTVGRSR